MPNEDFRSAHSNFGPSCSRSDKDPHALRLFFGQKYQSLRFELRDHPGNAKAKFAVTTFAQIPSFALTDVDEIVHDNRVRLVFKKAHHDALAVAADG